MDIKFLSKSEAIQTLLTQDEYEKLSTYSTAKKILNDRYNGSLLMEVLSNVSQEYKDKLFSFESFGVWSTEALSLISLNILKDSFDLLLERNNNQLRSNEILKIPHEEFSNYIIKLAQENIDLEKFILKNPNTFVSQKYARNNIPNVNKEYEFIFKKSLGKRDLNYLKKYLLNEEQPYWSYITQDLEDFLNRWKPELKSQSISLLIEGVANYKAVNFCKKLKGTDYEKEIEENVYKKFIQDPSLFIDDVSFYNVEETFSENTIKNMFHKKIKHLERS